MEAYKREFIEFMVQSDVLKFGDFTLKLLPTREHHCARGLHHFGIGTGKGFQAPM